MANFESTFKVCADSIRFSVSLYLACAHALVPMFPERFFFLLVIHKSDFCRQGYGLCSVEVFTFEGMMYI